MKSLSTENLNMKDRTTRIVIGCTLAMTPLYLPESTAIFTAAVIASIYPLLTGLVAIDPVLNALTNTKRKSSTHKIKIQSVPYIVK